MTSGQSGRLTSRAACLLDKHAEAEQLENNLNQSRLKYMERVKKKKDGLKDMQVF